MQKLLKKFNLKEKSNKVNLRERILECALHYIEDEGVENISLRHIARKLGISHSAPYRHFTTKDYLILELANIGYKIFAEYLHDKEMQENEVSNMELEACFVVNGKKYIDFALQHPTYYKLMFISPLPNPQDHPELYTNAMGAFDCFKVHIQRLQDRGIFRKKNLSAAVLLAWSNVHGLASLILTDKLYPLNLDEKALTDTIDENLQDILNILKA